MRTLICSLLLISSAAIANDQMAKLTALQTEMNSNVEKYCGENVQAACNAKIAIETGSVPQPEAPKAIPANVTHEIQQLSIKMKACGEDMTCLKKISDETLNKEITRHQGLCSSGNKDSCFWKSHFEITKKMQDLI